MVEKKKVSRSFFLSLSSRSPVERGALWGTQQHRITLRALSPTRRERNLTSKASRNGGGESERGDRKNDAFSFFVDIERKWFCEPVVIFFKDEKEEKETRLHSQWPTPPSSSTSSRSVMCSCSSCDIRARADDSDIESERDGERSDRDAFPGSDALAINLSIDCLLLSLSHLSKRYAQAAAQKQDGPAARQALIALKVREEEDW